MKTLYFTNDEVRTDTVSALKCYESSMLNAGLPDCVTVAAMHAVRVEIKNLVASGSSVAADETLYKAAIKKYCMDGYPDEELLSEMLNGICYRAGLDFEDWRTLAGNLTTDPAAFSERAVSPPSTR